MDDRWRKGDTQDEVERRVGKKPRWSKKLNVDLSVGVPAEGEMKKERRTSVWMSNESESQGM